MYELTGKVVLITGAANGIGAAFVKILVEQGAKHVRVLDVDETSGVLLQNELNKKHGDVVKFNKCDVTIDEQLFGAFQDVIDNHGYIDVVVNNAGVANESNSTFIRREIAINLTALINATIKAFELMRIDKGGRGGTVINVSSIAALIHHSPLLFVYSATKSAVLKFSTSIGKEPYYSTTGVRVVTVCYGQTDTGIMDNLASFDENINFQDVFDLLSSQTSEVAAQGTLEAFKKGESGSTWLINDGKPVQDVTPILNKSYEELHKLIYKDKK